MNSNLIIYFLSWSSNLSSAIFVFRVQVRVSVRQKRFSSPIRDPGHKRMTGVGFEQSC